MHRRILIYTAGGVAAMALSLFLALGLGWPELVVVGVGMLPMWLAAFWVSTGQDRAGGNAGKARGRRQQQRRGTRSR